MNVLERIARLFPPPQRLTAGRIVLALSIAAAADGFQLLLGPLGILPFDEIVDVITAILIGRLLGFHLLLLPTFVTEIIPVADLLPTWTGCVMVLIVLRKKEQAGQLPVAGSAPHVR